MNTIDHVSSVIRETLDDLCVLPMKPCARCGKLLRNDYGGLCMDCVDDLGVSEMFNIDDKAIEKKVRNDFKDKRWFCVSKRRWTLHDYYY